jgi:hypothetical protein
MVTNTSPSDVPEGDSPDCADVSFLPGNVFSRPCFKKVLSTSLGDVALNYGKSYVDNSGITRNLYLTSDGVLYGENISTPGTVAQIAVTTPGSYAKSITAFGREYICFSDGLSSTDIAVQFDGINLDRVTQDGPGAPPAIASLVIPPVSMAATGAFTPLTVSEADPAGFVEDGGYYTSLNIFITGSAASISVGDTITIAGSTNALLNTSFGPVASVFDGATSLVVVSAYLDGSTIIGIGGTLSASGGTTMTRQSNVVTVTTATPHNLQIGYRAQISGVPAATVGGTISTITINNEDQPGVATVTMSGAHGLVPGTFVSLSGIAGAAIGGGVNSISRQGQIVTVTMNAAHGLTPGASVTVAGNATASFNTTLIVSQVTSSTVWIALQSDTTDATGAGGTATINWPIPNTATPRYFEILASPSTTTFQVQINYSDGSWTGGTATYAWDGTYFVSSIPDATTFTYQQYGPNATSSTVGKVTPYGQAAPGKHQMSVLFLTRQGYVTRPSPPVSFVANGGQYLSVTNIPIGPSNVVARILAFTGAQGAYFFYIPAQPQVNGVIVGTSTQINDNTTTSVVLDFSDPTLFASIGISTQGNDLANQIVIDGALGFGLYGTRLLTYGQRNRIQNMLNMGFDGGNYAPIAPAVLTYPLGWNLTANTGGILQFGHFGEGFQITALAGTTHYGEISQSMYIDCYGGPIATGDTRYRVRAWCKADVVDAGVNLIFKISSVLASFSTTATINGANMNTTGVFLDAVFGANTPINIPSDLTFTLYLTSATATRTVLIDELSLIYEANQYLKGCYGSYSNNPEAFDGVSGVFGPSDDTRRVMDFGIVRNTLYLLTQDPAGRLHSISSTDITEPAGWVVNQIASNCGLVSIFAMAKSQANDNTGSGGEEWFTWISSSGIRIFGGNQPDKLSQEIQGNAADNPFSAPDFNSLNTSAQTRCWAMNDPASRQMWFGIPTGTEIFPNLMLVLNYVGLDTAADIANEAPIHRSLQGKMNASDLGRKWTRWYRPMNGAALMYRNMSSLKPVFFSGSAGTSYGNVYTLDPFMLHDDDYGVFAPYYVTCAAPTHDQEQQYQTGGGMKVMDYLTCSIDWVGNFFIQTYVNNLGNLWPIQASFAQLDINNLDLEWNPGQVTGQRIFIKFGTLPIADSLDQQFNMTNMILGFKTNSRMPVRGA